jgi:8-oxo-dGTP pyrophosphatase MutT (NUDIX family)
LLTDRPYPGESGRQCGHVYDRPMSGYPSRVLPPAFVARALEFARGDREVVSTRPAATVVLLRDARDGLQAYLLRRASSMAFAAGMHVFPGGSVDPRDAERTVTWAGPSPAAWARAFTASEADARSLVCAAVRETFEESGVLLAGPSGHRVVDDTTGESWEGDRHRLIDRSLSFAEMLERRGLVLRADLLCPWGHWITPEFEARRYDTRFFVAAVPAGQRARDVSTEADQVRWVRPQDALDEHRRGRLAMLPPTVVTLSELEGFATVADVLKEAWSRDVSPRMPKAVIEGDEVHLLLPGEPGYPA